MSVSNGRTFGLLRTNHKLTGNVKLTVSSKDEVYLNSIDANSQLTDSRFKKFRINPQSKLSSDLYRFFDNGSLPKNIIYDTYRISDDITSKQEFSKHFEQQYTYGVTRCNSNLYDESYCIQAPIWLDKDIPRYFVVFRNQGAKALEYEQNPAQLEVDRTYRVVGDSSFQVVYNNVTYTNGQQITATPTGGVSYTATGNGYIVLDDPAFEESIIGDTTKIKDNLISPSDIVAVFDLGENTNIGRYLRNHVNDPLYTDKVVTIDFANNKFEYTGIDLLTGVISTKGENLSDLTNTELDMIDFDELITSGFENNSLVSLNMLNMEFMFDDDKSEDYTFNRYFGFYCDDIDVGKFFLDTHAEFNKTDGLYVNPFYKNEIRPPYYGYPIEDPDGIKIIPEEIEGSEGWIISKDKIQETDSFYYIKDKYGSLYKLNNNESTQYHKLMATEMDSEQLFGFNDTHFELPATTLSDGGRSSLTLTVNQELYTGYKIEFYYRKTLLGTVTADHLPDVTPAELALIPDDYTGDVTTPYQEGEAVGYFFYPTGTPEQVAEGMTGAIDYLLRDKAIDAIHSGNRVILVSRVFGVEADQYYIKIVEDAGEVSASNRGNFSGGSRGFISRVRVDKDYPLEITNKSWVLTDRGYAKIRSISAYIDEPIFDETGVVTEFNGFDQYVVINIVDEQQRIKLISGVMSIYNDQKLSIGVLSLYDLKDIDFDFYKTSYTTSYNNEYKKYFKTPEDSLVAAEGYTVYKLDDDPLDAIIEHDGVQYNADTSPSFTAVNNNFTVVSGNPIVIADRYYNDEELKQFIGFKTLSIPQGVETLGTSADPDDLKNKFALLNFDQTLTEYDRLREIEKSTNILKSRIIPYITKWVLKGGDNVRDVEYRLNISPVFGETNFSPSFVDQTKNPFYFTHEWMLLGAIPEFISQSDLTDSTGYFNKRFDLEKLADTQRDYFESYFTVDDHVIKSGANQYDVLEVPTQVRSTRFIKASDQNFETFFRGVKVKLFAGERDYTNYKFAAVLNFNTTNYLERQKPFSITVVENRDYNNITFVVDVVIDDYKVRPDVQLPPFGEYLYLYVMDTLKRWNDIIGVEIGAYNGAGTEILIDDEDIEPFVGQQIQIVKSQDNDGIYTVTGTANTALGTTITISPAVPNNGDLTGEVRHYGYEFGLLFDYPDLVSVDFFKDVPSLPNSPIKRFRGFQMWNTTNVPGVPNPNNLRFENELFFLSEQLKTNENGVYGRIIGLADDDRMVQTSDDVFQTSTQYITEKPTTIQTVHIPNDEDVILSNSGMAVVFMPFVLAVASFDPIDVQNSLTDLSELTWFHQTGGSNVYEDIAQLLSFSSIAEIVNEEEHRHITYKLVENGVESIEDNTDFKLQFNKPSEIIRGQYKAVSPVNLSFPELPGENIVDYEDGFITANTRFLRYGGNFIPKFRDVFSYKNDKLVMTWGLYHRPWNEIQHTWNEFRDDVIFIVWSDVTQSWDAVDLPWDDLAIDINDLNSNTIPFSRFLFNLNTKFDTTVDGFGIIHNLFYHKVAPDTANILALPEPMYPSVGEVAIEKMDFNVLKSDFDVNFFTKYLDKTISSLVYGTNSKKDVRSFLGTKLLQIEKEILQQDYNPIIEDTLIDDVQYDLLNNDLAYEFRNNQIIFRISLENNLRERFTTLITDEYKKWVNEFNTVDGNFNDAIQTYINNNILNLFKISEVIPYVKRFNQDEGVPLLIAEENELILLQNGYLPDTNVATENVNNLEIILKYNINIETFYSFNLRVKVSS